MYVNYYVFADGYGMVNTSTSPSELCKSKYSYPSECTFMVPGTVDSLED